MKNITGVVAGGWWLVAGGSLLVAAAPAREMADASACQIMTKADVESVLHVTVDAGAPMSGRAATLLPKDARSCVYKRPGAPDVSMLASITVARSDPSMFDTILRNYEAPELAALGSPKPVAGLGEKAAYIPVGRQMLVYVKGYLVNISALDGSAQQAQTLAKLAIARL